MEELNLILSHAFILAIYSLIFLYNKHMALIVWLVERLREMQEEGGNVSGCGRLALRVF